MESQRLISSACSVDQDEDRMDLRRGPWTVDEDLTLTNYIAQHGEGRWNSLAHRAGLKRTGKSCRLRWLNYLRPDVRRGNITLEEQLMILELHSRWGNRWSKIAQYLPGRTDNEIKNYWRTRVQKQAKQLKCDVNSKQFKDTMRHLWMPRLVERVHVQEQAASASASASASATASTSTAGGSPDGCPTATSVAATATAPSTYYHQHFIINFTGSQITPAAYIPENSSVATTTSSDSFSAQVSPVSNFADQYSLPIYENPNRDCDFRVDNQVRVEESFTSPSGYFSYRSGFSSLEEGIHQEWLDLGETSDSFWNVENIWSLQQQQQLNNNMTF